MLLWALAAGPGHSKMRYILAAFVLSAILVGCGAPSSKPTSSGSAPAAAKTPASPADSSKRIDELVAQVDSLSNQTKLDEASDQLKAAQQLSPDDPRVKKAATQLSAAYAQRAEMLAGQGKLNEAQADLRTALQLDKDNAKAKSTAKRLAQTFADRAVKLRDDGKVGEAQTAVASALELDPENVTANRLAKRMAQDYALRAANLLDEGKEAEARTNIDAARKLDPKNELANTLLSTLTVDPEKELGTKYFRYTVKSRDTLSKISEQYLKDQYKFYLLARYNGITVPRSLQAQQVIKVPGNKPLDSTTQIETIRKTADNGGGAKPPKPVPPGDEGRGKAANDECKRLETSELERAYERCREAARLNPSQYQADADRVRVELIQLDDRKAREAYRRQDLDECIKWWDKVKQLDPTNEPAERERDRCVRLRDTINTVGTK